MRLLKRTLILLLIVIGVLFVGLALIPYFFKDRITEMAKTAINDQINGKVDFESVNISVFKHFPNLTLGLEKFNLEGIDQFEDISLAKVASFDLVLDLNSVLFGETIALKSIYLDQPEVNVLVLKDGKANYDIAKPDTTVTEDPYETADFQINLEHYHIRDGKIIYDDAITGTYAAVEGLNHDGSGAFTLNVYDLNTSTEIEALTVSYGGITYLDQAKTNLEAILQVDQENAKYTFKDNDLWVNQLRLGLEGFVQLLENDQIQMDLALKAPQNQFKDLFSLIPNAFIEGYENVDVQGEFVLAANAKGVYDGAQELILLLIPSSKYWMERSNTRIYPLVFSKFSLICPLIVLLVT